MQYRVLGDTIPAVEVMFDMPGEGIYTQSGGMAWMTDGIDMATNTKGGLMKGLGRILAGESLFMATYRAQRAGAVIAFASTVAGRILPVDVGAGGRSDLSEGRFSVRSGKCESGYYIYQKVFRRFIRRRGIYPAGYKRTGNGVFGD